jgi:hypothetical protein
MSGPDPAALGIKIVDEIGAHACSCMRRTNVLGVDRFLEEEMATPTRDDSAWAAFIVQWAGLRARNRERGLPVTHQ